mgnify:CR=1 FL=1
MKDIASIGDSGIRGMWNPVRARRRIVGKTNGIGYMLNRKVARSVLKVGRGVFGQPSVEQSLINVAPSENALPIVCELPGQTF